MALFGKKANRSSNNGDVPPELKPYYTPGSGVMPARRRALRFVLGLLILAIIATAGVTIWRYVHDHVKPANTLATNQTAQKPKTGTNAQSQASNTTNGNNGTSGTSSQPTQTSPSVTQSIPSDNNTGPQPSTSSGASAGTPGTSTNQALVNTGPGETTLLIAVIAALGGALLHYIRQVRRASA